MKILVIGAGGLLGSACLRVFNDGPGLQAIGTFRSKYDASRFRHEPDCHFFLPNALDFVQTEALFKSIQPSIVVNCVSLSKDILSNGDALEIIPTYSLLPHMLASFCRRFSARFIQISSDGVFSGAKGNYSEEDTPDSADLYGRAKLLGEVVGPGCTTLRTSMIGHDLSFKNGLVSWFLNQKGICSGYPEAIFSGFPVTVLAGIIRDHVIAYPQLDGLYNVAATPISKFDLLHLISDIYDAEVTIVPDHSVKVDRSLNAANFNTATGFSPPSWHELITLMRNDYLEFNG